MANCSLYILLLTILSILSIARASSPSPCPRTISISGQGSVTAVPDTASISTGVVTLAVTAQAALTANNRRSQDVLDTLAGFGIEERDIQTSFFSVSPRFERGQLSDNRRIIGYTVRNEFDVIVRNLTQLGMILDAVVRSGSSTVSGVRFFIGDDEALRDEARRMAVRDGVRRARLLAEEAGAMLGKVLSIQEGASFSSGTPRLTAFSAEAEVPVAVGESQVSASVSLEFELVSPMGQRHD